MKHWRRVWSCRPDRNSLADMKWTTTAARSPEETSGTDICNIALSCWQVDSDPAAPSSTTWADEKRSRRAALLHLRAPSNGTARLASRRRAADRTLKSHADPAEGGADLSMAATKLWEPKPQAQCLR